MADGCNSRKAIGYRISVIHSRINGVGQGKMRKGNGVSFLLRLLKTYKMVATSELVRGV